MAGRHPDSGRCARGGGWVLVGLPRTSRSVSPFPPFQSMPLACFARHVGLPRTSCSVSYPSLPKRAPCSLRSLGSSSFSSSESKLSLAKNKEAPSTFVDGASLDAEGVGFEPTIPVKVCWFSRPVHSTRLCHPSGSGSDAAPKLRCF